MKSKAAVMYETNAPLVIEEIEARVTRQDDFGFETTLSGRTYLGKIRFIRSLGYNIHMFYLWIPSPEMALARVRDRVENGGHDVPEPDVRRRYIRTLRNLFTLYRPYLNTLHFFDNSTIEPRLVFHDDEGQTTVLDRLLYDKLIAIGGDQP